MTNNYDERNFILSWNGLGQGFGAMPVVFLGTALIAGSTGYAGAALIFSILGIVLALIPAIFVKENHAEDMHSETREKYTIKQMFHTIRQVPELLILLVGVFCWGIFYTNGYGLFLAYYIFNDASLSIVLTLCGTLPSIVLIPFLPIIFRKVDKIVVARICCLAYVVCGIAICLLGPDFFNAGHMPVLYVLYMIESASYVLVMFAGSQLPVDLVEIAKYRTGTDAGGIISASYNFVTKLVNSLVSSITLLILGFYGFVSVEASSFDELAALNAQGIGLQTDRALEGLWNVSFLFPIIGFALAALAFFFVKVNRKKVRIYMQVNSGQITREEGEELLANIK